MRGMKHPLSLDLYEMCDEGVLVTGRDRRGVFDNDGRWISGDRFEVCPSMCGWIGRGPRVPTALTENRRFRSTTIAHSGDAHDGPR